jgi:hypothetical protein
MLVKKEKQERKETLLLKSGPNSYGVGLGVGVDVGLGVGPGVHVKSDSTSLPGTVPVVAFSSVQSPLVTTM